MAADCVYPRTRRRQPYGCAAPFSTNLVLRFDMVYLEDLTVRGLIKIHRLARLLSDAAIAQAGWLIGEKAQARRQDHGAYRSLLSEQQDLLGLGSYPLNTGIERA